MHTWPSTAQKIIAKAKSLCMNIPVQKKADNDRSDVVVPNYTNLRDIFQQNQELHDESKCKPHSIMQINLIAFSMDNLKYTLSLLLLM